jgi:NAD(P)-dependent dehydrogenase (short-subunit alcohol dehydrogenase family)
MFSAASRDFNPLHLSEAYARKSPFGERVVYGILGFAACLREVAPPAGKIPVRVKIDFTAPQFLGPDYTLAIRRNTGDGVSASLMDGSTTVMRFHVGFANGSPDLAELPETGVAPRQEARRLAPDDFVPGLSFQGSYAPGRKEYLELLELVGIERERWGDAMPLALLCTSYLTGMELPGETAAYFSLEMSLLPGRPQLPADFMIELRSHDERLCLVHSEFRIGNFAEGRMAAVARPPLARRVVTSAPGPFAGKTAVVTGASRGLGSALALQLAAQGALVAGIYARSVDEADAVTELSRGLAGRLTMERGDASDPAWCRDLKSRIRAECGGLDLLVLSAAPAMQPLRVEEACYERMRSYVDRGFGLVAAPLTGFLEAVRSARGRVLLISSAYVETAPKIWPHYVALKAAVEGLIRAAAADNPEVAFAIARPGKLYTDMTNTPVGRLDAEDPLSAAHRILQAAAGAEAGSVSFCS